MKSRLLIIIVIVIVSALSLSYYATYDSPTDVYISCTPKYEQIGDKCVLLKPEQYCKDWCDAEELSKLGCDRLALDYIFMATNLIDGKPDDVNYWNWIGMPDGLSEDEFERCFNIIKEKRAESETKKLWKSTDDWNSLKLIRNNDNLYCNPANEELIDHCYSLENIVFGDGSKKKEMGWKLYPGGAGWTLPENSTLTPIYKEVEFGMSPLDFEAMLDDKIFIDKCESNGGIWNYTYHDCEGIWETCQDIDGIRVSMSVPLPCDGLCLDRGIYRLACVFEYEN